MTGEPVDMNRSCDRDCSVSPFLRFKLHSQHWTLAYSKKVNKTLPAHVPSPLNYPGQFNKFKVVISQNFVSFSQNLNFIICLFAPTAPQLSLQIQVQISQKTWMRNVQFYYTYCYTKYRRIKSWNNSPVPPPPLMKKMPSLKSPKKSQRKKNTTS